MKIKLAEALLRRKELAAKVKQLEPLKTATFLELKVTRKPAHEGVDDITAQVPKISMNQATHAYDTHAKNLRLIDALIQQKNWDCEIELDPSVMAEYVDPYATK